MRSELEFQGIYDTYHAKIRRYLASLIGEADAEDVTQEVFLKVNAALEDFRGDSSLSTWIYRIATNAATDHLRSAHPSRHAEDLRPVDDPEEDIAIEANIPSLDRQLIRKEMNECIRGIVEGLPRNYRTVLILSDLEELSNNEIAGVLNISLETVKIRLHRARARLKEELKNQCNFYKDDRNELACDRKVPSLKFLKK
jgi:RNA polymerase sigma-70 factor (ECF subfamily)